jgi:hypothetical protein
VLEAKSDSSSQGELSPTDLYDRNEIGAEDPVDRFRWSAFDARLVQVTSDAHVQPERGALGELVLHLERGALGGFLLKSPRISGLHLPLRGSRSCKPEEQQRRPNAP